MSSSAHTLKKLILIRHGETAYNSYHRDAFRSLKLSNIFKYDPGFRDSPLNSNGIKQVKSLSQTFNFRQYKNYVIVSSPLSRAIDTAIGMLNLPSQNETIIPEDKICTPKIVILPFISESVETLGDTGLSFEELREKYKLFESHIDWAYFDIYKINKNIWWYHNMNLHFFQMWYRYIAPEPCDSVYNRIKMFKDFLLTREEDYFFIVGHSLFFKKLTGFISNSNRKLLTIGCKKMKNCEVRCYNFNLETKVITKLT